jgi:membrane fusion protein, multidrug efflux system
MVCSARHTLLRASLPLALCFCFIVPSFAQDGTGALRGIVRPVNEAAISTDISFPIKALPFREGQQFAKGEVLAELDCRDLEAQLKSAEAVVRAETLGYENNVRLAQSRAAGQFEVSLSRAKADQAAAELEAYQSRLSRCVIRAPYDGRVALMRTHVHEVPQANQPLMQIVGENDLEIDMLLPSEWLRWLRKGNAFTIELDETGVGMKAEILRIGATVDAVSQTVKVTGRFTGDTQGILGGMSGSVNFEGAADE